MIKRTIFLSRDAYLYTRHKQMRIDFKDGDQESISIPIEDIGVLVLESYRLSISLNLISRLLDNNVAIVTCNSKKMPQGLILNLDANHTQQERFARQVSASKPLKKQLWAQTVKQKIHNQGRLLVLLGLEKGNSAGLPENMHRWKKEVKSGDTGNMEARAAAYYWSVLFRDHNPYFLRLRDGPMPNALLNYGYAILRAVTARSLVASGLLPTLGIHHHNKYNAYALADDIMEPYRPFVDKLVYHIIRENREILSQSELTKEVKAKLLQIPANDVIIDGEKSPLMNAMQRTTASLYRCFEGSSRKILYPEIL